MFKQFQETLTFDDVLLVPQKSSILPHEAKLKTKLTSKISLNAPFLSAPMDTVTESKLAIAMSLSGGMGIIHKNLSIEDQATEVKRVKRFENGFIDDPMTVHPEDPMSKVIDIREEYGYKKVPVVDEKNILVGFISDVDYLILKDSNKKVKDCMRAKKDVVVGKDGMTLDNAFDLIHKHRLRTLPVVGRSGKLVSMVTRQDIDKLVHFPDAVRDSGQSLRVGAAIGVGDAAMKRAKALVGAGVDVLIVDTAHGHSAGVIGMVRAVKKAHKGVQVIAGNIASGEAAKELIAAGADAVKVGIGPGSICTTRVVAGIGVPQLSAVMEVATTIKRLKKNVPVIADGGLRTSGDVVKALAAGASTVMMGNMFAGTDESPGRIEYIEGRMYKSYRGMGSLDAMERGSKDRYGQARVNEKKKFVPEGVSGRVPYKGPVNTILYQLAGGLRSGMGYNGAKSITELQKRARFVKITGSSLKESHPHNLTGIDAAPNYRAE